MEKCRCLSNIEQLTHFSFDQVNGNGVFSAARDDNICITFGGFNKL